MYALIENQSVVQYPYTIAQFRASQPNTSFPPDISDAELADYGVVRVVATGQPTYNRLTQNCIELTPVYVNDRWEQNWTVVSASAAEIAARKQALQDDIVAQTQGRLDAFARTRQYDGILSACTYASSPTPKFAAEGQYCVAQRDATWAKLYEMLAEVEAGTRPIPSGYQDIEPELPALVWPL